MLEKRFNIEPPKGMPKQEAENWVKTKQIPIRLRFKSNVFFFVVVVVVIVQLLILFFLFCGFEMKSWSGSKILAHSSFPRF
jgi:hypothetical protein